MSAAGDSRARLRAFAPVVAALGAVFVLSQVYRYVNTLVAPEIASEFGLSAAALGGVGASFFFAFAAMQLPAGVLIDRFGPRRAIAAMQVFAVAGMAVAALSSSAAWLTAAMLLLGVGACCNLTGMLSVGARWLPADRFATMTGAMIALGATGHVLSTAPLAFAVEELGWRGTYAGLAALQAASGLVMFAVVRDAPPGADETRGRETLAAGVRGVVEVMRTPGMARLIALTALGPSSFFAVRGLWAGPYFSEVHFLDPRARGYAILLMALCIIAGNLIYGPLDRRLDTRRAVASAGAVLLAAVFAALAILAHPPLWAAVALFGFLGLFAPYDVLLFAHARALVPAHLVGRAMTTINFALFAGISAIQLASGHVIGWARGLGFEAGESYRLVFAMLAALGLAGLVLYRPIADARPSEDRAR